MMPMANYHFHLVTLEGRVLDLKGMELPDEASAREHARSVACELMRHREPQTRSWRVEVTDSARHPCFELLFASVDSTIDHLNSELRASIEHTCSQSATLFETIRAVKNNLVASKSMLARAEGHPHLAALPPAKRQQHP
jgi:hypothetical protein